MAEGGDAVARLHATLLRYDAFAQDEPPEYRRLVIGGTPRTGDTVLVVEGQDVRYEHFRRDPDWLRRVWVIAVVRTVVGVVAVLLDAF